jgi:hypothetical protein
MEAVFELVFEVLGEILLQVTIEVLAEAGMHLARGGSESTDARSGWRLMVGYALLGCLAGGLSVWLFPYAFAHSPAGRTATLLAGPVAAAIVTVGIGSLRARGGQQRVGLDRLAYAYLFALGVATIRHIWAL